MFVLAILALVFQVSLAQQFRGTTSKIYGCDVTQYQNVLYNKDNLFGANQFIKAASVDECVSKCLQNKQPCVGINYLSDQQLCGLAGSSLNPSKPDRNAYQYPVSSSVHASINCAASAAGSTPVGCGKQAAQYQPNLNKFQRIINGVAAKPNSWPWLVNLNMDLGNGYGALCGSTLIRVKDNVESSDILLTAAHCVTASETQGTNPRPFAASQIEGVAAQYDVKNFDGGEQHRTGAKLLVHPGFKFTPQTGAINDIALIKLDRPIAFNDQIRPACLPAKGEAIPVGKTCVVAGWGRVNGQTQETATVLQQVIAPAQSADQCRRGWGRTYQEDLMICAGSLKGDSGTCQGDSGGTLACQQNDGSWTVYGAVSFGVAGTCLSAGMPSVFTRVSNYMDWVNQNAQAMTSL